MKLPERTALNWPTCLRLLLVAALAVGQLSLAGCAGRREKKDVSDLQERPVQVLYDTAFQLLQRRRYVDAAHAFDSVEREHPYSIWARRSMLMSAFSYYEANKYDDAVNATDRFLSLHPGNKDAPYAYYLKAICYYEQISDVGRDQEKTLQALNALQEVVRRYPQSEYARDARLKIDLTRDHLAGKEMYVGRYYLKHRQYIAAIDRFQNVITTYQTTSHVPEALLRLTEAYYALGLDSEAKATAAVLGYNYPNSVWYKDSYALLVKHGAQPNQNKPTTSSWVRRTWRQLF
jgi:outer membrane protein assembly factor BamD